MEPRQSGEGGLTEEQRMQIESLVLKLKEGLEGAASGENPTPGVGPLTEILLGIHTIGCSAIAQALHKAENELSLRRFDNETDAAANTAKIQKIHEILSRLIEICSEHHTTEPKPAPSIGAPPEPTVDGKQETNYINVMRRCDPDGKTREDIRWNERRLDDLLEKNPDRQDLINWRRSELARLRGQLCPCLNNTLSTAKLAGDAGMEEMVKGLIGSYCNTPTQATPQPQFMSNDEGAKGSGGTNSPPLKKAAQLGTGSEFKSVQAKPGDGRSESENVYLPPIAGPGSTIVATVVDPGEPGPQSVIVGTVDEAGNRKYYETKTDEAGHLAAFAVPAGAIAVELFRAFDKNGIPSGAARTEIGTIPHVSTTEPLATEQIPAHGPAITEANSAIEQGGAKPGTVTLHTRGTDPGTTQVLLDGKPMETYAASDSSVIGRVPADVSLGTHQISITSRGMKSNTFQADVISTQAAPLAPMHTGSTQTVRVQVRGVPAGHQAMMHFEVSGAAKLRSGAPSMDVPVKNGMATVEIRGVHAGGLVVKYQLHVAIPGFLSEAKGGRTSTQAGN